MEYRGNWKLFMENVVDLVHPQYVHGGSVAVARERRDTAALERQAGQTAQLLLANGLRLSEWEKIELKGGSGVDFERKFRDPDGVVFDISHKGWVGIES
jgi:phenylpropionate dioxygenase-like ring-hydroxylating dioxygenase large terminal subunit